MTEIHLVGNGVSNRLYDRDIAVTACNIPQHGIRYNQLSIIDRQPLVYMKNSGWRPKTRVLCTQSIKDHARKMNLEGDWFAVYEAQHRWNSGHHAVNHFAKNENAEIHFWGFDSMWSKDLTSQMDTLVPRYGRPDLNKHWRPIWQEIFDRYSDKTFVIHAPLHVEEVYYAKNAKWVYHETQDQAMDA